MAGIAESARKQDFGHRKIGCPHKPHSILQTYGYNVFLGRHAYILLKNTEKLTTSDARITGYSGYGQMIGIVFMNVIGRAVENARALGFSIVCSFNQ